MLYPSGVLDLLEEFVVVSIAGNSEEHVTLRIEPFYSYFGALKIKSQLWTLSKLDEHQKGIISLFPRSIELLVGGKKIALCHFANDVRFDYTKNGTYAYQTRIKFGNGYRQFLHTNSEEQLDKSKKL